MYNSFSCSRCLVIFIVIFPVCVSSLINYLNFGRLECDAVYFAF